MEAEEHVVKNRERIWTGRMTEGESEQRENLKGSMTERESELRAKLE